MTASAALLLAGSAAKADPSVAEIEKQIDTAWNKLEPTIEKHNATRQQLEKKKAQATELQKKIEPLQLQVDLVMNQVGELAAQSYKSGPASGLNSVLRTGSATDLANQLEILDQFAHQQEQGISSVITLKKELEEQKAPLDELVKQLTQEEADLGKKAKAIDSEIDKLQKLRLKVAGSSGGSLRPSACPYEYPGGDSARAIKFACAQIGKPYYWGADGPGSYDCSGLMLAAWAQAGITLPHNAAAQRGSMKSVSRANLRAGDLVFYYSDLHHVGMYAGNGYVVHAPSSGDVVRMKKMDSSPIHSFGRPG